MIYPRRSLRPTASMIHEFRMIAQSFFAHRTKQTIFGTPKSESPSFICVPCARLKLSVKAVALHDGESVCRAHLG